MIYKLIGKIDRVVTSTFEAHVKASSAEEAQDVLYEVLSDYPNSEFSCQRLLKTEEECGGIAGISIEFDDLEDVEHEFDDEDD